MDLEEAYTAAFEEWECGDDAPLWETTADDGLDNAAR